MTQRIKSHHSSCYNMWWRTQVQTDQGVAAGTYLLPGKQLWRHDRKRQGDPERERQTDW